MNPENIPSHALRVLRRRYPRATDQQFQEMIRDLTPEEVFCEYCNWEGLIGYGPSLWRLMKQLSGNAPVV